MRLAKRSTPYPAASMAPLASAKRFVVVQVRQALQQTAGHWSLVAILRRDLSYAVRHGGFHGVSGSRATRSSPAVAFRQAHRARADQAATAQWGARRPARPRSRPQRHRRVQSRAQSAWRLRRSRSSRGHRSARSAGRGRRRAGCAKSSPGQAAIRARCAGCAVSQGRCRRARGRPVRECR
jgi:hypothetical protein